MFLYYGKKEPPLTIDGVKSWVDCHHLITRNFKKRPVSVPSRGVYHHHDYIEILYGIDADMNIWVNGECFPFTTGDLAIIYSNELHAFVHKNPSNVICIQFSPHILYADDKSLFEFKYLNPSLNENKHQRIFHGGKIGNLDIESLAVETMREWQAKGSAHELIIQANILRIFAEIYRFWHHNDNLVSGAALTDTIKKAIVYISENISTATAKDVADFVGLNSNYFSDLFKKETGRKFTDYIAALKIQKAESLLLTTNKSMFEISVEVGFSSPSYFISQFKKHKNITPKQFRIKTSAHNIEI